MIKHSIRFLMGIIILVCVMNCMAAASINWQEYSDNVFEQAKTAKHPVILFAKSETCHWCKQMESKTFSDVTLIELINSNYLPVILDVDKNIDIADRYQIMDLPTVIIFDLTGKPIKTLSGFMMAPAMIKDLKELK